MSEQEYDGTIYCTAVKVKDSIEKLSKFESEKDFQINFDFGQERTEMVFRTAENGNVEIEVE